MEDKWAKRREYNKRRYHSVEHGPRIKKQVRVAAKGLTVEQFDAMVATQEGKCLLCEDYKGEQLRIDHCHNSKKVRGLLCNRCNSALGQFQESPELLQKAIDYLMVHR